MSEIYTFSKTVMRSVVLKHLHVIDNKQKVNFKLKRTKAKVYFLFILSRYSALQNVLPNSKDHTQENYRKTEDNKLFRY